MDRFNIHHGGDSDEEVTFARAGSHGHANDATDADAEAGGRQKRANWSDERKQELVTMFKAQGAGNSKTLPNQKFSAL
jgi:hypothetical protein